MEKAVTKEADVLDQPISSLQTQKVVHVLEEDVEVVEAKNNLISTTDAIKNINVIYDEIAVETISEDDFVITNATPIVEEVNEKESPQQMQADLLFDLPLNSINEVASTDNVAFELITDEVKNLEVNDATEIVVKDDKVLEKRYVLEDFEATPTIGKSSSPKMVANEIDAAELQLKVRSKTQEEINDINTNK